MLNHGFLGRVGDHLRRLQEYAVYKGDIFICIGTAKECAEYMDIKEESFRFYLSPTYQLRKRPGSKNRIIVDRLGISEE